MKFRSTLVTASILALTTVGGGVGIAYAYAGPAHAVPAPPAQPTRADQIQNVDQVKTAIIVANFGDQYSDLKGGYAQQAFKLPNPMYYLP